MFCPKLAAIALLCVAVGCYGAAAPRPAEPTLPADAAMSIPATLVERMNRSGDVNDPATPRPLLTLEEFFEGNDDFGSIGYNLPDQPSPAEFYSLLKEIRDRTDVADVRIEILDHPDPSAWPSSDTVWIITTAFPDQVKEWLDERIRPDDVLDGWTGDRPREPCAVPPGHRPIGVWWD